MDSVWELTPSRAGLAGRVSADMDDPGELFRFWLMHRYHEKGSFVVKLAAALKMKPVSVGHWLRRRGSIHTSYWPTIARFFERDRPEQLIAEARALWAVRENRRYYTLHEAEQRLRRATAPQRTVAARVHPETPAAAAASAGLLDAATSPNRRRRPARRVKARKGRGTPAGASER